MLLWWFFLLDHGFWNSFFLRLNLWRGRLWLDNLLLLLNGRRLKRLLYLYCFRKLLLLIDLWLLLLLLLILNWNLGNGSHWRCGGNRLLLRSGLESCFELSLPQLHVLADKVVVLQVGGDLHRRRDSATAATVMDADPDGGPTAVKCCWRLLLNRFGRLRSSPHLVGKDVSAESVDESGFVTLFAEAMFAELLSKIDDAQGPQRFAVDGRHLGQLAVSHDAIPFTIELTQFYTR